MAYIFNKVFSDNFARANEQPLNTANWTVNTGAFPALAVVNHLCVSVAPFGQAGTEFYTGSTFGNDQYATATLANNPVPGAELDVFIRSSTDAITSYYSAGLFVNPDQTGLVFLLKGGGQIGGNVAVGAVKAGDTLTVGAIGTTIFLVLNGVQLISGTDATFASGRTGMDIFPPAAQSDMEVSYFETGKIISQTYYSSADSRRYGSFPNSAELESGTYVFDVQTSSNSSVPGTDSRTAGAPVDSRASKPTNSRTPGTFGPGE